MPELSATVVVPTYCRPDYLRRCLQSLWDQSSPPAEIIVVDASPDPHTAAVVGKFPNVIYKRNEKGRGSTATSRAIGVAAAKGDVVAFVDDDTVEDVNWLRGHLRRYSGQGVAAVAGRTLRGDPPGEVPVGPSPVSIGLFLADGTLTANFDHDPGHDVDVDHAIGANMSFRRSTLVSIGGIHDYYPGTCIREETDIALRLRRAGHRIVFAPDAVNYEFAGPYAKGARFDLRYMYYAQRNHLVLLKRVVGVGDIRMRRYLLVAVSDSLHEIGEGVAAMRDPSRSPGRRLRGLGRGASRATAMTAGIASGLVQVVSLAIGGK